MSTFEIIVLIIVACYIIGVFVQSFSEGGELWEDLKPVLLKIILFVPVIIAGTILYIIGDFKNHRLGYIVIFAVILFLGFGVYMGYKAGPGSPPPWE